MKSFYNTDGNLNYINDDDGRTIAILLANGSLHPNYDTTEARSASVQYPNYRADKVQSVAEPNWKGFSTAMIENAGYKRIYALASLSNSVLAQQVQIALSATNLEVNVLRPLWLSMLNTIIALNKPTAAEVAQWNLIAKNTKVPLSFASDGSIV